MDNTLKGVKVLDLSRLLPGPLCSMYLADFGAQVLKVEDPFLGDYARDMEPFIEGVGALYQMTNRGKNSLTLNLKDVRGKEIFYRLVSEYDVVIEGFRPKVMDKLGLSYEILKKINPRIIYCSITGFGQEGPEAQKAGHDLNYIAISGMLDLFLKNEQTPGKLPPVQIADIVGGTYHSLIGILLALFKRSMTGEGSYLDISMTKGAIPLMIPAVGYILASQESKDEYFNPLDGSLACYNVYNSKDGKAFALGALEEKFWKRFCEVADIHNFLPNHWEKSKQDEIVTELRGFFQNHTAAEITELFIREDVCLTPVVSSFGAIKQFLEEPKSMFQQRNSSSIIEASNPLIPSFDLNQTPFSPTKGESTESILVSLGYSKKDIKRLWEEQVI